MQSDLIAVLSPSDFNVQILVIFTLFAYRYVARYEICITNYLRYVPLVVSTSKGDKNYVLDLPDKKLVVKCDNILHVV
jgi:hypothetical protein